MDVERNMNKKKGKRNMNKKKRETKNKKEKRKQTRTNGGKIRKNSEAADFSTFSE